MSDPMLRLSRGDGAEARLDRREYGYRLADAEAAANKALESAVDLVRRIRHLGAETRSWASRATTQTRRLMARLRRPDLNESASARKMWELTAWENEILGILREYMQATADHLKSLKSLNPPLSSVELRPFVDAMDADRQTTVKSLESLSKSVSELTALKATLGHQAPGIFLYNPAP